MSFIKADALWPFAGSGRSSQVISPINTQADADFGGMAIPQQQTSSFVTKEKSYQV